MPSFNGDNIFGTAVSIATPMHPPELQKNPYTGLNGVQALSMGQRGGVSMATGLLFGSTLGDLRDAEAAFRNYYDGRPYVLVDSYGQAWANVVLNSFVPKGRIMQSPFGVFFRQYEAQFDHLTNS